MPGLFPQRSAAKVSRRSGTRPPFRAAKPHRLRRLSSVRSFSPYATRAGNPQVCDAGAHQQRDWEPNEHQPEHGQGLSQAHHDKNGGSYTIGDRWQSDSRITIGKTSEFRLIWLLGWINPYGGYHRANHPLIVFVSYFRKEMLCSSEGLTGAMLFPATLM